MIQVNALINNVFKLEREDSFQHLLAKMKLKYLKSLKP